MSTEQHGDRDARARGVLIVGGSDRLLQGFIVATAPALILRYTDSGIIVGIGNACQYSAWVLFGLVAGGMADAYDRLRIIRASSWLRIVVTCVAAIAAATGHLTVVWIVLCVSLLAASLVFTDSALNASMPALFDRTELLAANSGLSVVQSIGGVVAPVVGTFVLTAGEPWLFLLMTLPTLATLLAMRNRRRSFFGEPGGGRLRDRSLSAGFHALVGASQLRRLLAGVAFLNLMGGAYLTVLPVLALSERGISTTSFGAALAVQAVALVLTNVVIARSVKGGREVLDGLLFWSFALRVLSFALVGSLSAYPALLASMALSGTAMALWNVPASSKVLEEARGDSAGSTLTSFKLAAVLWTPLGAFAGGLAVSAMDSGHVVLALAGLTAAVTVCFSALAPNQSDSAEDVNA